MPVINLPTIVKGNTFSLAIPLQVYIVQDDELVLVDYVPESGDNITVRLKGERRNYTYIPSTNANIAYIHLGGNELVGLYAVEVEIVKDDDSKLTSFRLSQLNIVESIDEISGTELIDNVEQGVIYLNPEIFVAGEGGRGIVSITLTGTSGLVDTYTITYTDNTTSTFTVTNGEDGRSEQSDWAQTDPSADDYIKNKPSLATVATSGSYNDLLNKPTLPAAQVQSDWNVSDISSKAYIKNKPTIDTALSSTSTNAVQNKVVKAALDTKVNTSDLASVTEDSEGAGLVGYGTKTDGGTTTNVSVKDALDEIYESIGDGGDLATRVTALEEGKQDSDFFVKYVVNYGTLTNFELQVVSVDKTYAEVKEAYEQGKTLIGVFAYSGMTGENYLSLINTVQRDSDYEFRFTKCGEEGEVLSIYMDKTVNKAYRSNPHRVKQSPVSSNEDFPMLLAGQSGISSTKTTYTKYDTDLKYNPSTNTLKLGAGTLTATDYSGNAATATSATNATNATNDGSGNNIANTYALKSEIMNPHPTIVTTLPTADGTHHGFYFVKDTSSTRENVYTEYIEVQENSIWKWEPIGSTDVTLDVAYLTTSEVETIWNDTSWT